MKPAHKKEQRIQKVRKIHQRLNELFVEKRNLGLIKLEKPIRHGWFKELIITNHVERYKNQQYIKEVYAIVEKRVWAKTKDKAQEKWYHQTSKYLIDKEIPTINKRQYNRLSDGAKRLCTPFQYYTERKKLRTRFYINIPKGAYNIKFTRAYITYRYKIDQNLEQEYAFLWNKLLNNGLYEAEKKLFPWKDKWSIDMKEKEERKIKKLKKHNITDIVNEEITWEHL